MSVKTNIDTLTIDGQTKLFFTNNSGDSKVAVSTDTNGFVGYSTTTTLSSSDEQFKKENTYTINEFNETSILKNRNYILKSNEPSTPNSETVFYIENTLQTTKLGDKLKVTNITFGGNPAAIGARTLDTNTWNKLDSTRWIIKINAIWPHFSPNQHVFTGFATEYVTIRGHSNEYTLLYSPIGMCKNGVRLTVTLGTSPNQYTYTSTDYVWYRTKSGPDRMERYLSSGTPPTAQPIDPGPGGGPFPGGDPFPGGGF